MMKLLRWRRKKSKIKMKGLEEKKRKLLYYLITNVEKYKYNKEQKDSMLIKVKTKYISKDTGIHYNEISRILNELDKEGYLKVKEKRRRGTFILELLVGGSVWKMK